MHFTVTIYLFWDIKNWAINLGGKMSRTEHVKTNMIFNFAYYIARLLTQFVLRTLLIYFLGAEYIGLNGLFSNIFQFLNLAELGIGSAIVFSMYKPIAEGDAEKLKSLQSLYKKFYFWIAVVVLIIGGVLTPFLNLFINGGVSVDINIYLLFVLFLLNAVIGYFSAHKRSLLYAHQRNDIENKVRLVCVFFATVLQALVIILWRNYYLFYAVNIVFTLVDCILIHIAANKLYPEINGRAEPLDGESKKEITKNVVALSMQKLGSAVVFSTDNILVSAFFGVIVLGAYSNYALIITSLVTLINVINVSMKGSVGDLIASRDSEYVYQKFKQTNFIISYICSFCLICMLCFFQPFIRFWTGGGIYMLNNSTMILLCVSFYFTQTRIPVKIYKETAGLFWKFKWKSIIEAIVNLGLSIALIFLIGIDGVVLGTIISTLTVPLWVDPLVVYKGYFKKPLKDYFITFVRDLVITAAAAVACYFVCSLLPEGGFWLLILKLIVCIVLSNALLILLFAPTKDFKNCVAWVKSLIKTWKEKRHSDKAQKENFNN